MKLKLLAGLCALGCLAAGGVSATTYDITIHGTVTSAVPAGVGYAQGDTVTLHAVFTDFNIIDNGTTLTGYTGVQTSLVEGPAFNGVYAPYTITLGSFSWSPFDDLNNGGGPAILIDPSLPRLVRFSENITFTPYGVIKMGNTHLAESVATTPRRPEFETANVKAPEQFLLVRHGVNGGLDSGVWDYANAVVLTDGVQLSAAPEPSTWGLMIAGFGLVGAAMRRRRRDDQISVNA